jgi:hypothetical protein
MKPDDPKTADFLAYLNDWFYRELSSIAHSDLPGMILQAKILLAQDTIMIPDDPEMNEADITFLRSLRIRHCARAFARVHVRTASGAIVRSAISP